MLPSVCTRPAREHRRRHHPGAGSIHPRTPAPLPPWVKAGEVHSRCSFITRFDLQARGERVRSRPVGKGG